MVRGKFAVWVRLPDVPVMVTVFRPVGAVPDTVSVIVLVPVVLVGLKDAVTPVGRLADKATDPVNPAMPVTVTVVVPLLPWAIVRGLGEAARE